MNWTGLRNGILAGIICATLVACGGGGVDTQTSSTTPPPPAKPNLNLRITGLKNAVLQSSVRGGDESFSVNVSASKANSSGRSAGEKKIVFSKRISISDVNNEVRSVAPASSEVAADLNLPPGNNVISVDIFGDQSGTVTSESIAINASADAPTTLISNVNTIAPELAVYTNQNPVNVSLFAPIPSDVASVGNSQDGPQLQLSAINPNDGTTVQLGNIQAGNGGSGYLETYSDGGVIGFLTQKDAVDNFKAFVRADDGSFTPLPLPPGASSMTLSQSPEGNTIYILNQSNNQISINNRLSDGTLQEISRVDTGIFPSAIHTLPLSRLLVVTNAGDDTISVYSIGLDGMLELRQTAISGHLPLSVASDANETFAYVSNGDQTISRFNIGSTKLLTLIDTAPAQNGLSVVTVDPTGQIMVGLISPNKVNAKNASHTTRLFDSFWVAVGNTIAANNTATVSIVATVVITAVVTAVAGPSAGGAFLGSNIGACWQLWQRGSACMGYSSGGAQLGAAAGSSVQAALVKPAGNKYIGYTAWRGGRR